MQPSISMSASGINVLIFFEYSNHYQTVDNLCLNLSKNGINVASFNIAYWRFRNWGGPPARLALKFLSAIAAVRGLRAVVTKYFRKNAMLKLADDYDIIDIHFFSPVYDELIKILKKREKKVKITIWGSDFYRVNETRLEQQRSIYNIVDLIQIETEQIKADFLKIFPEFESKIGLAHFGIVQFDIIDNLLQRNSRSQIRKELNIQEDQIAITCGTNGSEGHQHLLILENIEKIPADIRDKLYLLFPMTYGGNRQYLERVEQRVKSLGIPYTIFKSFLSLTELCKIRISSDILVTIQKTDALASAIQEHLFAGDILIAGEWLPYENLNEIGTYYLKTGEMDASEKIYTVLLNINFHKNKCSMNKLILSEYSSWNAATIYWINNYHML